MWQEGVSSFLPYLRCFLVWLSDCNEKKETPKHFHHSSCSAVNTPPSCENQITSQIWGPHMRWFRHCWLVGLILLRWYGSVVLNVSLLCALSWSLRHLTYQVVTIALRRCQLCSRAPRVHAIRFHAGSMVGMAVTMTCAAATRKYRADICREAGG